MPSKRVWEEAFVKESDASKTIKDKIMEKLTEVKITLMNGDKVEFEEALDIGLYYYLLNGRHIISIKKSNVVQISWESKTKVNDSSAYVKN